MIFFEKNSIKHNTTFKELYNRSKIDFNVFCYDVEDERLVCLNHINTPYYSVIDGVYNSCTIPFMFKPLRNSTLIDAGIITNYPIKEVLKIYCEDVNKNKKYNNFLMINLINASYLKRQNKKQDSNIISYLYNIINSVHSYYSEIYKEDFSNINVCCVDLKECETDWNALYANKKFKEDILLNMDLKIEYI